MEVKTSGSRGGAEIVLRAGRPGDCEAIAALHNLPGFRWGTLRRPFHSPEELRKRLESQAPGDLYIVALEGERIVGDAGLHRMLGRRQHAAEIGMGVHDAHHGRGIGTALLSALLDTADRWLGLTRVELTVFADNERAIRLYERAGFEVEGRLRAFALRDGHLVDGLAMARLKEPPRRLVPTQSTVPTAR